MDDIKLCIDIQKKTYTAVDAYTYFAEELEMLVSYVFGIKTISEETGSTSLDEKRMLRNIIITVAHKIYLEKYFKLLEEKK